MSLKLLLETASIGLSRATLTIKAVCQTVTHLCIVDWDTVNDDEVKYYRLDELP